MGGVVCLKFVDTVLPRPVGLMFYLWGESREIGWGW